MRERTINNLRATFRSIRQQNAFFSNLFSRKGKEIAGLQPLRFVLQSDRRSIAFVKMV